MRASEFAFTTTGRSTLRRSDAMVSPRVGLLVKPVQAASIYANYSVSYLPSAGDQFSSLNDVTKALEPEKFENLEAGAKWDLADRLSLTTAIYRLDRSNTRAPYQTTPASYQRVNQRSSGYELGHGQNHVAWKFRVGTPTSGRHNRTTAAEPLEGRQLFGGHIFPLEPVPVAPASPGCWSMHPSDMRQQSALRVLPAHARRRRILLATRALERS